MNGRAYPWHPVAWDDLCSLPFARLDRLLVAYAEHDRTAALAEIERLISDYPSQRPSALRARTRLVVRAAAGAPSLASLDALAAPLPEGERGFLAETARVKQWIGEISAVQRQLDSADRPLFRAPLASLLELLVARCREVLASSAPPAPARYDLSTAFAFFADIDRRLAAEQGRLLIALDEYEMLDQKIGEGVLPSALLDTLRESIQSHRRITWLVAGSHEIAELPNAAWTSYLVSARTLEVALFTSEETTMLLSDPLRHSRYYQQPGRQRPRFAADFWGADGIDRIHREAGGWPHLVQLLAETAVDLANDRGQRTADAALLEESFAQAVVRGTTLLQELLWRECQQPGEWQYLRGFVRSERQPPPIDAHVYASLRRRLLVLDDDGACRLRVPLMRRWLVQRAWTIPD